MFWYLTELVTSHLLSSELSYILAFSIFPDGF